MPRNFARSYHDRRMSGTRRMYEREMMLWKLQEPMAVIRGRPQPHEFGTPVIIEHHGKPVMGTVESRRYDETRKMWRYCVVKFGPPRWKIGATLEVWLYEPDVFALERLPEAIAESVTPGGAVWSMQIESE